MAYPQTAAITQDELDVGQRLSVCSLGRESLGLGTYLWDGVILLDRGTKIAQGRCRYERVPESPVPPFLAHLHSPVRAFHNDAGRLYNKGLTLGSGRVTIEEVSRVYWNHGIYVAGRFQEMRGEHFWLLLSELDLPDEYAPFLQVVS